MTESIYVPLCGERLDLEGPCVGQTILWIVGPLAEYSLRTFQLHDKATGEIISLSPHPMQSSVTSALLGKTPPANADFYDPQDEAAAARDAAAKQFLRPLMAASIVQKVDAV
jgi:hypothetical protein